MPDRRTLIMLGSLLAAMTLTSGLLLMLEPRPAGPVSKIEPFKAPWKQDQWEFNRLFDTDPPLEVGRWRGIVIHDSRSLDGSLAELNELHARQNRGGLGYHFVIDNGLGGEDGQIEVGFRWQRQFIGQHSTGPYADLRNTGLIGICLIGHGDEQPFTEDQLNSTVLLVQALQRRLQIPADQIYVESDQSNGGGVGRLFPFRAFRERLLTSSDF